MAQDSKIDLGGRGIRRPQSFCWRTWSEPNWFLQVQKLANQHVSQWAISWNGISIWLLEMQVFIIWTIKVQMLGISFSIFLMKFSLVTIIIVTKIRKKDKRNSLWNTEKVISCLSKLFRINSRDNNHQQISVSPISTNTWVMHLMGYLLIEWTQLKTVKTKFCIAVREFKKNDGDCKQQL